MKINLEKLIFIVFSCASCSYEHETYDEGATFISPRNPCLSCTCEVSVLHSRGSL